MSEKKEPGSGTRRARVNEVRREVRSNKKRKYWKKQETAALVRWKQPEESHKPSFKAEVRKNTHISAINKNRMIYVKLVSFYTSGKEVLGFWSHKQ